MPISGDDPFASQAWAGGKDDDDDDDGKGRSKHKSKDFDHFACYSAGEHGVFKDVKIINQFTTDEFGKTVMVPITVGELVMLCVPTKKIHER